MQWLLLWAVLLTGCGGRVVTADGGTPGSGEAGPSPSAPGTPAGGDDAGNTGVPEQVFGICPPAPPNVGASCTTAGQGCAYIDPSGVCTAFLCDASGRWRPASGGC